MTHISHLQQLSSPKGVERARSLRWSTTDAERALWQRLRARQLAGVKFRRQVPLGSFVVDFLSEECRLIVELDGGQHAGNVSYDEARTKWLEGQGYRVVRFWNNDVLTNIEGVLQALTLALQAAPPAASCGRFAGATHALRNPCSTLSQGRGDVRAGPSGSSESSAFEASAAVPSPLGEGQGEGSHE